MNDTLITCYLVFLPVLLWAWWKAEDSEGHNLFFGVLFVAYIPFIAALALVVVPLWLLVRRKK